VQLTDIPAGFTDAPAMSNEAHLEAIQMVWHEEFENTQN
jgi:FeS assembly protein IscX